jgi:Ca-activated chloride channel family protein
MSGIRFHSTGMLLLLWVIPFIVMFFVYAGWRRRQALGRFAEAELLSVINVSISLARRRWKAALVLTAFVLITVAAARPAWNPVPKRIERRGRDVIFVLDVSRSMLAEDLAPNRLERAKLAIRDCIERLQGDRVGLVAFAGSSVVKCPLTLDYGFFRLMLENISTESVSRGGTMIGDAVRKCVDEVFDDRHKEYKDIILITDGEDHDSFPVEAATEAGERGIRIIAIGIGDEEQGKRIPITDEQGRRMFLKHDGQEIWSKLDADTLRKMVNATPGGRYLNVATGTIDLGQVYMDIIASAEKKALESRTVKRYEEKFQIFAAFAFILLCVEMAVSERKRRT